MKVLSYQLAFHSFSYQDGVEVYGQTIAAYATSGRSQELGSWGVVSSCFQIGSLIPAGLEMHLKLFV